MITRIFTFGYGHVCPFTGKDLADHYAVITAPDASAARTVMNATFNRMWAYEYDPAEPNFTNYAPRMTEHVRLALGAEGDGGFGYSREADDDPTPVSPARVPLHTGSVVEGDELIVDGQS